MATSGLDWAFLKKLNSQKGQDTVRCNGKYHKIAMHGNKLIDFCIDYCLLNVDYSTKAKLKKSVYHKIYGNKLSSTICRMYINYVWSGWRNEQYVERIPNDLIILISMYFGEITDFTIISPSNYNYDYQRLKFKQENALKQMNREELIKHAIDLEILLYQEKSITHEMKECTSFMVKHDEKENARNALIAWGWRIKPNLGDYKDYVYIKSNHIKK